MKRTATQPAPPSKVYCSKHPDIEALVYQKIPGQIEVKCVWCIEVEAVADEELRDIAAYITLRLPQNLEWRGDRTKEGEVVLRLLRESLARIVPKEKG